MFLVDAIAYVRDSGLLFDEALTWSDEPLEQKPVLRSEHVDAAMRMYGRRFGRMNHDRILFFNNMPEGRSTVGPNSTSFIRPGCRACCTEVWCVSERSSNADKP